MCTKGGLKYSPDLFNSILPILELLKTRLLNVFETSLIKLQFKWNLFNFKKVIYSRAGKTELSEAINPVFVLNYTVLELRKHVVFLTSMMKKVMSFNMFVETVV